MSKLTLLQFNDPAPDLELLNGAGQPVRLSSLWQKQVLILAFTRHFGCPQCKEMLAELSELRPRLTAGKLGLAIVTQAEPQAAQAFCAQHAPGLACLADPARLAYQAYGLGRASLFQSVLSPRVMKSNQRLEREKGWKPEMPPSGQDAFQMSGTFVIGTDGRIRLPYYYDDIADHPSADLLLRGLMGMDWATPLDSPLKPE